MGAFRYIAKLRWPLALAMVGLVIAGAASAQAPPSPPIVTVSVVQGAASSTYPVLWSPNMTFLNAVEQALPAVAKSGSFSLNYFPQYGGYFFSAVGGIPAPGGTEYWSTCLLPAGPGSTVITVPIAPNKILVGIGDTVGLIYNLPCPTSLSSH